ncbi:hypothetical protein NE237_018952 [Protea cynaroides]|uniref:Uncharacterized protein n=1 Tax=Protea cynaroides TaxID=273540 RepID=A0A9Q0KAS9_9MAGN|nr:hypothetical protein NE237_018952 [Protea cynaroides]
MNIGLQFTMRKVKDVERFCRLYSELGVRFSVLLEVGVRVSANLRILVRFSFLLHDYSQQTSEFCTIILSKNSGGDSAVCIASWGEVLRSFGSGGEVLVSSGTGVGFFWKWGFMC